jgi:hypothetical protein
MFKDVLVSAYTFYSVCLHHYIKLNHTVTNILFVSDLRYVCGFLCVLRFPPPQYMTEILLKVALNTLTHIYWKVYN